MPKSNGRPAKKVRKIYLDYASSITPNPSSIHEFGVEAKRELESARARVADVLSARPSEIIFTSGGTESNNLAIRGVVLATSGETFYSGPRLSGSLSRPDHSKKSYPLPHIITTNIEHPSVLETFRMLEKRKLAQISIVPVETNGIVDPKKIKKEIRKNTILVSVMYANNEIGTIQPIREIAKEIRHYKKNQKNNGNNIVFHTDAVQAGNYLDLNVERLGVDMMSVSGSKIDGAGRAGALYKKKYVPLEPIFSGGDQEMGLRAGTENLQAIVNFSHALESAQKIKDKEVKRLSDIRDFFIKKLSALDSSLKINGDIENRLPNNVNITIPNIPSDLLVIELSAKGIMSAAKSACKSGDGKASHVIEAIDSSIRETDGSLRFSFGKSTTKKDIEHTLQALKEILKKLKKWYN